MKGRRGQWFQVLQKVRVNQSQGQTLHFQSRAHGLPQIAGPTPQDCHGGWAQLTGCSGEGPVKVQSEVGGQPSPALGLETHPFIHSARSRPGERPRCLSSAASDSQQKLTEQLLSASCCFRSWGYGDTRGKHSVPYL